VTLTGYDSTTGIARFYNRDYENEVGFEMQMSSQDYFALSRYLEKVVKDVDTYARQELAATVRGCLPQEGNQK